MTGTSCNDLEYALKCLYGARLTCGDKWLVWYGDEWVVCQRKAYQKKTRTLIQTDSLNEAVKEFMKGE